MSSEEAHNRQEQKLKAGGSRKNSPLRTAPGLQTEARIKVRKSRASTALTWLRCGDALWLHLTHPASRKPALPQPVPTAGENQHQAQPGSATPGQSLEKRYDMPSPELPGAS